MIVCGSEDPLLDDSTVFGLRINLAKESLCKVNIYEGYYHGFLFFDLPLGQHLIGVDKILTDIVNEFK